jgi:outer membrane protein assembly factor BamB
VKRRWYVVVAGVALLALGVAAGFWVYEKTRPPKEVRGSSTVEFHTNQPPVVKRPPTAVLTVPWPTYGYDDQRTRVSPFPHRPPYRTLWKLRTRFYIEYPPTVGYGHVFVTQLKGRFFAVDPKTGTPNWTKRFDYCTASSPTLAEGLVIQTAVPAPCGKISRSLPGQVVAMRPQDGKIVWHLPIASESTPVVVDGVVYIGAWNKRVYALRAKTGKVIWSTETDGEIDSSPAYANKTIFVGNNSGSVYALDAKTGRVRWIGRSFSGLFHGREYFYATPAVAYGRVYAPNTDGTVYVFGATTGHLLWARHVGTYVYTAPAIWQRKVYVGTYDGRFYALDAATGDVRWVHEATASIHGAPTVMGGLVYYSTCGTCGEHGIRHSKRGPRATYALDARTGKLVWTFPDGHYSPVTPSASTSRETRSSTGSCRAAPADPPARRRRAGPRP